MALTDLSNTQTVLLGKAVGEKVWKAAAKMIGQGTAFEDSLTCRIRGSMKIGKSYEQAITLTFPWQRLALMLATRVPRHVLDAVLRELRSAESPGDLKDHVYAMWAEINVDSQKLCNGKVTGRPTVEIISEG